MIYTKKQGFVTIAMFLFVFLTLSACSRSDEENRIYIEKSEKGIVENGNEDNDADLEFFSIDKVEKYEGMEITDWLDEYTVVMAKENQEFERMSLLENAEFYPRSIYTYNLDNKQLKTIKAQKNLFLGGAVLSPDKKHLLYYEYSIGDIAHYMMSLEEGQQSSVTEDSIGGVSTAEWTDEQSVIGVGYVDGAYIADTDGNSKHIAELQEEQLFSIHKRRGNIYYITTKDRPPVHVYKLDEMTKEKKNLQLENVDRITLSHDGKYMLVTQATDSMIRLVMADTDGNIQSTIAEGSNITDASWSPDQHMIAYQLVSVNKGVESSGLYLYNVSTGKSSEILQNVENAHISWSPSGNKISVAEMNEERNFNSSIIYIK